MTTRSLSTLLALFVSVALAGPPAHADSVDRVTRQGELQCDNCLVGEQMPEGEEREACEQVCREGDGLYVLLYDSGNARNRQPLAAGPEIRIQLSYLLGARVQITGLRLPNGMLGVLESVPLDPERVDDHPRDIELHDLEGKPRHVSELRGKPLLINFFATWCAPCRAEMPIIEKIWQSYKDRKLQVLGAAGDHYSHRAAIEKLTGQAGVTFPVWTGANGSDTRHFGLSRSIPATALLDPEGKLYWSKQGVVTEAELREQVSRLLAGQPPATAKQEPDAPGE